MTCTPSAPGDGETQAGASMPLLGDKLSPRPGYDNEALTTYRDTLHNWRSRYGSRGFQNRRADLTSHRSAVESSACGRRDRYITDIQPRRYGVYQRIRSWWRRPADGLGGYHIWTSSTPVRWDDWRDPSGNEQHQGPSCYQALPAEGVMDRLVFWTCARTRFTPASMYGTAPQGSLSRGAGGLRCPVSRVRHRPPPAWLHLDTGTGIHAQHFCPPSSGCHLPTVSTRFKRSISPSAGEDDRPFLSVGWASPAHTCSQCPMVADPLNRSRLRAWTGSPPGRTNPQISVDMDSLEMPSAQQFLSGGISVPRLVAADNHSDLLRSVNAGQPPMPDTSACSINLTVGQASLAPLSVPQVASGVWTLYRR